MTPQATAILERIRLFFQTLSLPAQALGGDNLEAGAPLLQHRAHDLGRILQVGVQDDHRIAVRSFEAGADGGLMAKIPRQPGVFRLPRGGATA